MISSIISRLVILVFGTLYPAYASYKAVRTKSVKEYVKWMMYWIVFALFTCAETFTDVFLSWFPFYYEIKIVMVIWLLSPATNGSSILYRKFVHPTLSRREQEIDEYITKAKEQSYKQVLDIGSKGVSVLMQTAIKSGGGIVNHLRRSYSLSDLSDDNFDQGPDETDMPEGAVPRRRHNPLRSVNSVPLYFPEVDVRAVHALHVKSVEDISSGYSSADGLYTSHLEDLQDTQAACESSPITRSRGGRVTRSRTVPKNPVSKDEQSFPRKLKENTLYINDKLQHINQIDADDSSDSSSGSEFLDSIDKLHENSHKPVCNLSNQAVFTACKENSMSSDINQQILSNPQLLDNPEKDPGIEAPIIDSNRKKQPRGGRYNKKVAPNPLVKCECNIESPDNMFATKATLVLKPGILTSTSSTNSDSSRMPKLKFKSYNKFFHNTKLKFDSFSKLVKFQKTSNETNKHPNLQRDSSILLKRTSCNDVPSSGKDFLWLLPQMRSKSDNNLRDCKQVQLYKMYSRSNNNLVSTQITQDEES